MKKGKAIYGPAFHSFGLYLTVPFAPTRKNQDNLDTLNFAICLSPRVDYSPLLLATCKVGCHPNFLSKTQVSLKRYVQFLQ